MTITEHIKYTLIRLQSILQQRTIVSFFGTSYIVSGNIVKKLGNHK